VECSSYQVKYLYSNETKKTIGGSTDALTIFLIIVSLIFNLAFYGAVGYYFLKAYRKKASKVTRKIATKVKESIDKSRSRSNRSSDSNSSNSDTSRSKESANVKEFDDIMNDINLDSPTKKDEEKNKDNSESNISDVPNETYDSPVADQRLVYSNNNISGNNSSVVRNFNVKPLSLHGRTNNNFSVSFNNSSLNLLSPGMNSGFSSGRKLLNNTANQDSNLLRPRQRSDLAFEFKANEYSDSRNLGISYEDSPRLGISRIQHQASYQDDSLILKIPNTPSELKSNSGTEENANKET